MRLYLAYGSPVVFVSINLFELRDEGPVVGFPTECGICAEARQFARKGPRQLKAQRGFMEVLVRTTRTDLGPVREQFGQMSRDTDQGWRD